MESVRDESIDVEKAINFAKSMEKPTEKPATPTKRTYEAKPLDPHKKSSKMKVGGVKKKDNQQFANMAHGTIISDEKGFGIVVDNDYALRQIAENDPEYQRMLKLADQNDTTFENIQFTDERPVEMKFPIEEFIEKNPFSEEALKIKEVRDAFKGWDICAMDENTGAVLAPSGSPQCTAYKDAMNLVRSGKVRLPTVDEYEEQLRKAREEQEAKEKGQTKPNQPQPQKITTGPKPKEAPAEEVQVEEEEKLDTLSMQVKLSEEAQKMTESERNALTNSATEDPMVAALRNANAPLASKSKAAVSAAAPKANPEPAVEKIPETAVTVIEDPMVAALKSASATDATATPVEPAAPAPAPEPVVLNIGAAEVAAKTEQEPIPVPVEDESKKVVIEVPAAKADTFMKTLPDDVKSKVDTAEKIKINFVGEVELPNTVRRLSTLKQYRTVAPKNIGQGVTSAVMINSGYIAYFSPVGALEWAMISPVRDDEGGVLYPDNGKLAQFVYTHLVNTSIGPLSYAEFCEHTSFDDMGQAVLALMRGSQPDDQTVSFICYRETCGKEYMTKYKISELPDYDRITPETKEQMNRILLAKDTIEDARDVHNDSPSMKKLVYQAKSTKTKFIMKNVDVSTVIDRSAVVDDIKNEYGDSIALLAQYTVEAYIKTDDTGDPNKDYSVTNEPLVIAAEYMRLTPDDLHDMYNYLEAIPRFDVITYSMKGRHVCPHCGAALDNPRQDILDLVFHIALVARYVG